MKYKMDRGFEQLLKYRNRYKIRKNRNKSRYRDLYLNACSRFDIVEMR